LKISKFLQVLVNLNDVLKPDLVQKQSRLKVQLSHGYEIWTLIQDTRKIRIAVMKFMEPIAG